MKSTPAVQNGIALMRAIGALAGGLLLMVGGIAATELAHWLLAVPLWIGAGALIWNARPAIIKEIREADREDAHPFSVPDTGRYRRDCPCCGWPTWEVGVDTCLLCEWAPDITTGSGTPISLAAARASVASHLSIYPQDDRPSWSPAPLSPEEIQLRRALQNQYRKIKRGLGVAAGDHRAIGVGAALTGVPVLVATR